METSDAPLEGFIRPRCEAVDVSCDTTGLPETLPNEKVKRSHFVCYKSLPFLPVSFPGLPPAQAIKPKIRQPDMSPIEFGNLPSTPRKPKITDFNPAPVKFDELPKLPSKPKIGKVPT